MRRVHTLLGCIVVLLSLPAIGLAQDRLLTLLYDPAKRVNFNSAPPFGLIWLDDQYYL